MSIKNTFIGLFISMFATCACALAANYTHVNNNKIDEIHRLSGSFQKHLGKFVRMLNDLGPDSMDKDAVSDLVEASYELSNNSSHIYELMEIRDHMVNSDDRKTVENSLKLDIKDELKTSNLNMNYANKILLSVKNVEIGTEGAGFVSDIRKYRKFLKHQLDR